MSAASAVTINRSQDEIMARLPEAEPPLSDEAARVSFAPAPGNRGTEVRVVLDKTAPGGRLGQKVAAAVGTEQVLEAGEVIRSEGSPEGTDAKQQRKQRPAEPVAPTSSD